MSRKCAFYIKSLNLHNTVSNRMLTVRLAIQIWSIFGKYQKIFNNKRFASEEMIICVDLDDLYYFEN